MLRAALLEELAARISGIRLPHPVRVGIDGVDAAGKTAEARAGVEPADVEGFRRSYDERYVPGQRLYLSEIDPERRATVVVDSNDLERPVFEEVA